MRVIYIFTCICKRKRPIRSPHTKKGGSSTSSSISPPCCKHANWEEQQATTTTRRTYYPVVLLVVVLAASYDNTSIELTKKKLKVIYSYTSSRFD